MRRLEREKAEMFQRRRDRKEAARRGVYVSPLEILYKIIKEVDPQLKGSEDVRRYLKGQD